MNVRRSFGPLIAALAVSISAVSCSALRPAVAPLPQAAAPLREPIGLATTVSMYVANSGGYGVLQFPISANGDVRPARRIGGTLTQMVHPASVGVDGALLLYAPLKPESGYPMRIGVFTPNQRGDVAPVRVIVDAKTTHVPVAMAADANGVVYVLYSDPLQHWGIDEFPVGANGLITPFREIAGAHSLLEKAQSIVAMTVDANGGVWWACSGQTGVARVVGYAPGATGDVKPAVVLQKNTKTEILSPTAVAVDEQGFVYIETPYGTVSQGVLVFKPGATGQVVPVRKMQFNGSFTLGAVSSGVLVAPGVVNQTQPAIATFDAHKGGLQNPVHVISGLLTRLSKPAGLTLR